jgi:hypothetical protein
MASEIDTNVNNYTVVELMTILGLDYPDEDAIIKESQKYIEKFELEGDEEMIQFFNDIQEALLEYAKNPEDGGYSFQPGVEQTNNWIQNQALRQDDPIQTSKITERKQKIDVYANQHVPMKREQLGINNNFNVDVAQDVLNPNLKNTTTRLINLDSQYRQVNAVNGESTDYVLDLNENILDVLSLRLYSFQIPYAWYTVDNAYNNTCFWISFRDADGNTLESVTISVEPGNYTTDDATNNRSICYAINASLASAGFTGFTSATPTNINPTNGKCTMNLNGGIYTSSSTGITYNISYTTMLTFFDPTTRLSCNTGSCKSPLYVNQTLGWLLGYRVPELIVNIDSGNIGTAIADFFGPKYLILVIDDYNQNHINSGLIGITEYSNYLKLPSYYSPDIPYVCTPAVPNGTNLLQNSEALGADPDAGTLVMEKYNATYNPTVTYIQSAPRTLTRTQLYAINQITKNNEKTTNYRTKSPTATDTFAIIPVKRSLNARIGDLYVDFGGSLQDNKRIYFGPVNLERLHVKLLDDKGNLLNLNGADWSITLITENLYQY